MAHAAGPSTRCFAAAPLLFALLLASCDQGSTQPTTPTQPSGFSVRSLTVVLVPVDSGYQANAVAAFSDGSSREVTSEVQWTSSDPNVASVSTSGRVTVMASGAVEIRALYQGVSGGAQLTVAGPPPTAAPPAPPGAPPPAAPAARTVTVTVVDSLDRAPVSFVRVEAIPAGQSEGTQGWTNGHGQFEATAAWGDSVTIRARRDGYETQVLQRPVTDATRIEFPLKPLPFTLTGTVRDNTNQDGVWCEPVRVEILDSANAGRVVLVSNPPNYAGPQRFEFTNVQPGRFTIRASANREYTTMEVTARFRGYDDANRADFYLGRLVSRPSCSGS